jgi:hypothetical protein
MWPTTYRFIIWNWNRSKKTKHSQLFLRSLPTIWGFDLTNLTSRGFGRSNRNGKSQCPYATEPSTEPLFKKLVSIASAAHKTTYWEDKSFWCNCSCGCCSCLIYWSKTNFTLYPAIKVQRASICIALIFI